MSARFIDICIASEKGGSVYGPCNSIRSGLTDEVKLNCTFEFGKMKLRRRKEMDAASVAFRLLNAPILIFHLV